MFDLEILEHSVARQNFLQQFAQAWEVPLSFTELVNSPVLNFPRGGFEGAIKSTVCRNYSQSLVKHNQGLADGANNAFGVTPRLLGGFLGFLQTMDVREGKDNTFDYIFGGAIRGDADLSPLPIPG